MSEDYKHQLLSDEFAAMFFGFTPRGFTDQVYNCVIDAWKETVEEMLEEPIFKDFNKDKNFRQRFTDIIFVSAHSSFRNMVTDFTNHTSHYIFRIPDSVTLPIHRDVHRLNIAELERGQQYDFKEEEKKARSKENEIVQRKAEIAVVQKRIRETDIYTEKMQRMLEVLKKKAAKEKVHQAEAT